MEHPLPLSDETDWYYTLSTVGDLEDNEHGIKIVQTPFVEKSFTLF
jgi:hypothetical protein